MDIGDSFPEGESGFMGDGPPMQVLRIRYQLSQRFSDQEQRFQLFKSN